MKKAKTEHKDCTDKFELVFKLVKNGSISFNEGKLLLSKEIEIRYTYYPNYQGLTYTTGNPYTITGTGTVSTPFPGSITTAYSTTDTADGTSYISSTDNTMSTSDVDKLEKAFAKEVF